MGKLRTNKNKTVNRLAKLCASLSSNEDLSEEELETKVKFYTELYNRLSENKQEEEADKSFKIDNLEYDLRSTDWLVAKAKANRVYCQNLYAALCNNSFQKQDVWPIIKNKVWSCSWRYAGGIIADILEEGDYMDWYCSGMGGLHLEYDNKESWEQWEKRTGLVSEGTVTEEIIEDLRKLGWQVITEEE